MVFGFTLEATRRRGIHVGRVNARGAACKKRVVVRHPAFHQILSRVEAA
jgi:hypothetical protein